MNDIHKCDEMVRGVMDKAYIDNMGRYASLEQIRQQGLQAGNKNWKTRAKFWIDICQNHTDMGKDHVNMRTENKGVFVQSMQHFEYLMLYYTDEYTGEKGEQHTFLSGA